MTARTMVGGAAFLVTAQSRLLPLSIPFRFFVAAGVYHLAFWAALALTAGDLPSYTGGLGTPLAAVHLLTLGVLTMTVLGAGLQLLPVATRRPVAALWPCRLVSWLVIPGVAAFAHGLATTSPGALAGGGVVLVAGLLGFAGLMARNLLGVTGFRLVILHVWAALAALVLLVALGLLLALDVERGFLAARAELTALHLVIAAYGFMGLLAIGFSFILVPMFALSGTVATRRGLPVFVLSLAGMALACLGIVLDQAWLIASAAGLGALGAGWYVALMLGLMRTGMRKRLGLSFLLVRVAWGLLPLSLLLGAALAVDLLPAGGPALFGFVLLVGWLLTFLLGILQRIAPFLASMHSAGGGRPALLSDLTPERPLKLHAACHFAALLLVGAGILGQSGALVRLGALLGVAGALAFLVFLRGVLARLAAHRKVQGAAADRA